MMLDFKGFEYSGTPLMRTPLGPTQSVLIREGSLFRGLSNICMDRAQCPHYSECLYFRGVRKAGFGCS